MHYLISDTSTCNEEEIQRMFPLVPQFRQKQALRYKHIFGQWACLKTWVMLQELTDCPCEEIYYGPHGKPYLKKGPYFSISHCKTAVAVAVDDEYEIGIDIESIRHANQALIERTMNKAEQALIAQSEKPDYVFTDLWTQKEAVLKARGTGIVDDLDCVLDALQTDAQLVQPTIPFAIVSIVKMMKATNNGNPHNGC